MKPLIVATLYNGKVNFFDSTIFLLQYRLDPAQTAGKIYPYLYTQCQSIFARTLLPCQDTPSVKASYTSQIMVPKPLVAVMSAIKQQSIEKENTTLFSFEQKIPIPTYLIALAVGALEGKKIGPRSTIWTEKEMVCL